MFFKDGFTAVNSPAASIPQGWNFPNVTASHVLPYQVQFEPDDRPIFGDQILNIALSLKWNFIDSFCQNQKTDAPYISTMPETKN